MTEVPPQALTPLVLSTGTWEFVDSTIGPWTQALTADEAPVVHEFPREARHGDYIQFMAVKASDLRYVYRFNSRRRRERR